MQGAQVVLRLAAAAVDGKTFVAPVAVRAISDAEGRTETSVWPSARGDIVGHYDVRVSTEAGVKELFEVVVPDAPEASTHELLLGDQAPLGTTLCTLSFALVRRTTGTDGQPIDTPAAGVSLALEPDRWDVSDSGLVVPTEQTAIADETGVAQVQMLSSGLRGAQVLVTVRDAQRQRWDLRLQIPASLNAAAAAIAVLPTERNVRIEGDTIYLLDRGAA